jgi:hypothetical protein
MSISVKGGKVRLGVLREHYPRIYRSSWEVRIGVRVLKSDKFRVGMGRDRGQVREQFVRVGPHVGTRLGEGADLQ